MRFSFVAHLLPIDQGMLASCYLIPSEPIEADDVRELFEAAYAGRAVRAGGRRAAAHARRARDERCPRAGDRGQRARAQLLRHRQPLEGRRRPGRPGPEPDARAARDGGSYEVERARPSSARAGSSCPCTRASCRTTSCRPAFGPPAWRRGSSRRASTWPCSSPTGPTRSSAARFTTNARVGAPVIVSRQAELGGLRAVAANSGCSNVGDGQRGLDTAMAMQAAAAAKLGLEAAQVGVASTGVIGIELPREPVVNGVEERVRRARPRRPDLLRGHPHQRPRPQARLPQVSLSGGAVRLAAQAKGAGMISPRFATMFCFIETDAAARAATPSSCSPGCASSARSTASAWTDSSPRATP